MFNVDKFKYRFHSIQWVACNIPGSELTKRVNDSESKRQDYINYATPMTFTRFNTEFDVRYSKFGKKNRFKIY